MLEELWLIGGDNGPCVNPLIDGIVCDEAIEYSELGAAPYGLLMRGKPELYDDSALLAGGPSRRLAGGAAGRLWYRAGLEEIACEKAGGPLEGACDRMGGNALSMPPSVVVSTRPR